MGHSSSRGKGLEIPDAKRMVEKIDLEVLIVTGDAIFWQKTITSRIVGKGGDYVVPVKRNQKDLHEEIATAFNEPFFPRAQWQEQPQAGHGRIDQRNIELLPADALGEYRRNAWPTIRAIAWVSPRHGVQGVCQISTQEKRGASPDHHAQQVVSRMWWKFEVGVISG